MTPAVQYVRASTGLQSCSLEQQGLANSAYVARLWTTRAASRRSWKLASSACSAATGSGWFQRRRTYLDGGTSGRKGDPHGMRECRSPILLIRAEFARPRQDTQYYREKRLMQIARPRRLFAILALSLLAAACASQPYAGGGGAPGFFSGLWHGFVSPIALVAHIFIGDIRVYEFPNSGGSYDFGFLLGAGVLFGGTASSR